MSTDGKTLYCAESEASRIIQFTVNADGWLNVTPDFIRAYYTRPEIHPVDTSCAEEIRLFEDLMAEPFLEVAENRLERLADRDAALRIDSDLGIVPDGDRVNGSRLG